MSINGTNTQNLNKSLTSTEALQDSGVEIISGDVSTETIDSKGRIGNLRSGLGFGEYSTEGRAMVSGTIFKNESQHTQTANKHANFDYKMVGETPPPPGALDFWPEFYARGKGVLEWDVPETKNFLPPPPPPPPPPGKDPLLLDLNGDGIELTSQAGGTQFDLDGDGTLDQTSWTKRSNDFDDAFLVLDSNKNGEIDSGIELFGDQKGSANGYLELSKLDSNKDGAIDAKDTAYKDLQLWADMDGDGKVGDGELKGLEELGVKSISTKFTGQVGSKIDANGNDISLESTFTRVVDGEEKTLNTVDAFFVTDAAETNQRTITSTQAGANSVVTTRSTSTNNASISPDEINSSNAEKQAERFRKSSLSSKLDEAEANKQAYESELASVESEVNNATSKSSTVKITKAASSEDEETEAVDVSSSEDDTAVLSRKDSLTADISSIDSEIENLRSQIE
jgi:hypothetical protein